MTSNFSAEEEIFLHELFLDEVAATYARVKRKMADAPDGIQTSVFISSHPRFKDWRSSKLADPKYPARLRAMMKNAIDNVDGGSTPAPAGRPAARDASSADTSDVVGAHPPTTPGPPAAPPSTSTGILETGKLSAADEAAYEAAKKRGPPNPYSSRKGLRQIAQSEVMANRIWERLHFAPKRDDNLRDVIHILANHGVEDRSILRPTRKMGTRDDGAAIDIPQSAPEDFLKFFADVVPFDVFLESAVVCGLATDKGNLTQREKAYQDGTLPLKGAKA